MDNDLVIAWASGFLEGDGSFDARQRWRASSTCTEHLDRLVSVFGGSHYPNQNHTHHEGWKPQFEWSVSTKRTGHPDLIKIIPGLSQRRIDQLRGYGFSVPEQWESFTTEQEWAWLAGFIDAEGHVCGTGRSLSTNLILVQVYTDEPLVRARDLIGGGSIQWYPNKWNGSHRYGIYGKAADTVLRRILPYLCEARSSQVRRHWEAQSTRRGHS